MATTQRSTRRAARRRAPADLLLGVLLLATLALGVLVLAPPFEDYRAARQRVALLEQQAAALEVENERLDRASRTSTTPSPSSCSPDSSRASCGPATFPTC
jgi:anti-sigma factor RsiW